MSDYLLIGPVLLQGFELPDHISWGGGQRLIVHKMPGGGRILDSLGVMMPIFPGRASLQVQMPVYVRA